MADKKSLMVNPIRTNPGNNKRIETPNFMGNFGIERKSAEKAENFLYQWDDIKLKNEILFNESKYAEDITDISEYINQLSFNKEYYSSDIKLNELKGKIKKRTEEFERVTREAGYDSRFTSAYIEKTEKALADAELKFQSKFTEFTKGVQTENYALLMDTKEKNMSRIMINGDIESGIDSYREIAIDYMTGNKNDFISMPQAIARINRAKTDLISADLYSMVNNSDGKKELLKMASWGKKEFLDRYKDMEFEYDGFNSMLTTEDFELFQREIGTNLNRIERKESAEAQKSMYDANKAAVERQKNPVKTITDTLPYNDQPWQHITEITTAATNLKYGTDFENWKDQAAYGLDIIMIDSSNSMQEFYNDPNISGLELIAQNSEEAFKYFAGQNIEDMKLLKDYMSLNYRNLKVSYNFGGRITELCEKGNTVASETIGTMYTPQTRKVLETMKESSVNITAGIDTWAYPVIDYSLVEPTREFYQEYGQELPQFENKYLELSIFGKFKGIKMAANNGDVRARALTADIEQIANDKIKLMVINETNGIIDESVAKFIGNKKLAGTFITDAGKDSQSKILQYYAEDPKFMKKFQEEMNPFFQEVLSEMNVIDTGNGRMVTISNDIDSTEAFQVIFDFMKNNTFETGKVNEEGKPITVSGKNIVPESRIGKDEIVFTFNGNPLLMDGKPAILDLKNLKKSKIIANNKNGGDV